MTHPYPTLIAVAAGAAAFSVGIRWGTFAAGGSDSSCYLNEARLFSHGLTHIEEPLVNVASWPDAAWTFTPARARSANASVNWRPISSSQKT